MDRRTLLLGSLGVAGSVVMAGCTDSSPDSADTDDALNVKSSKFGAVGDWSAPGVGTDDTAAFLAAIDAAASNASGSRTVLVPAGSYRITAPLNMKAAVRVHLVAGAKVIKDWASASVALFRNDPAVKSADDVWIYGEGGMGAAGANTGRMISMTGNRMTFAGFTIDGYNETGLAVIGDQIRCHDLCLLNPSVGTGVGGIRFAGGDRFLATACHVDSGDDALQFVPTGDSTGIDITNSSYVGCTGSSNSGKFMAVGLNSQAASGVLDMTASVTGCSFVDCHGSANAAATRIQNINSSGVIRDLTYTDCMVDLAGMTLANVGININNVAGTGGVNGITFRNVQIDNPLGRAAQFSGEQLTANVLFDGCHMERGRVNTTESVMDLAGSNTQIVDGVYDGAGGLADVISIGTKEPLDHVTISAARIIGITDGFYGINSSAVRLVGLRISGCTFEQNTGATTAQAIRVSPAVSQATIERNDLSMLTSDTKLTDEAPDTIIRDNIG